MASLKPILETLDGLPDALKPFYVEKDGKFILDAEVDGHPAVSGLKTALEKERQERKEAKERLGLYGDLDPEAARTALEEQKKNKEKKLVDAGKIEELFAERIGPMKAEYEKQIKTLSESNAKHLSQLEKLLIESAVQAEASRAGVHATALEDVVLRAKGTFKLQNGAAVAVSGENVVYGKDGVTPLSVSEWMSNLQGSAPHLFKPSQGGGAAPGAGVKPPNSGAKTMARDAFDNLGNAEKLNFCKTGGTVTD